MVIHGKKLAVAYRMAYDASNMADKTVWEHASRLMGEGKVRARVEQLRQMADVKLEVTVEKIAKALARIGFFDIRECYDDKGALLPPHELPEFVALALDGMDVVEMAGAMKVALPVAGKKGETAKDAEAAEPALQHVPVYTKKVRFSRMKALETMAKWKRMIVERVEHVDPNDPRNMTDEELEAAIRADEEALKTIERARSRSKKISPSRPRA